MFYGQSYACQTIYHELILKSEHHKRYRFPTTVKCGGSNHFLKIHTI